MNKTSIATTTDFLFYTAPSGKVQVEVYVKDETIWLTQVKMAELFDVQRPAISKHLRNIFEEGELDESLVCSILEHTTRHGAIEGKTQLQKSIYYNLDAIIAVGYRVNSKRATHFRIWATQILKEYIIKGFAMNDERLKDPHQIFGKDYFEEQLARIRDIRSSERRFYQKITDIYASCSADYNPDEEITKMFFATVQNKLHWAISGQTAAEIITSRVGSSKLNMGLTNWKNSPKGKIRKTDVTIAKNYLKEEELDDLNRIVSMYLDYAESQAKRHAIMYMKDWVAKLDAFLKFNEREILHHSGSVAHEVACEVAEKEFDTYLIRQDRLFESDFDKEVARVLKSQNSTKKIQNRE